MQRRTWWLVVLTVGWGLIIGSLQYFKYRAFGYNGLDLGIYSQALWNLSHGFGFASSIHDPSYLGDHVELWLIPLAGLYRLWSNPLLALWMQTAVLAISVIPLSRIVKHILGERFVTLIVGLFFLHPLLYNAALYEFHGLVFALPILFWMIQFYLERRYGWWLLAGVGLLLVREDMPLLLAGWAVASFIDRRNWRWWAIPAVLSIGYFFGAQAIIRSANALDTYKYLAFYAWLGQTPREMVTFPFRHPLIFLGHVFSVYNWQTAIGFLLTFGTLPLFQLRRLWPAIFVFFQLTLLGAAAANVLRLHYVLPYLPFLTWASLETLARVRAKQFFPKFDQSLVMLGASIFAVTGVVYGHLLYGIAEWPWKPDQYASRTPAHILQSAVDSIQPNERVLTTFNLLPALSQRVHVYSLNYVHLGRRQYTEAPYSVPGPIDVAVIDWQQYYDFQFFYRDTLFENKTGAQRLADLLQTNGLELVKQTDSLAIYRHTHSPLPDQVESHPAPPTKKQLSLVEPVSAQTLRADGVPGFSQIETRLHWQLHQAPELPWSIHFWLERNDQVAWESLRLLGNGLHPSSEWTTTDVWDTTYRLAIPDRLRGTFKLKAEVVSLDGPMRLNRVRSFVPRPTKVTPILSVLLGSIRL